MVDPEERSDDRCRRKRADATVLTTRLEEPCISSPRSLLELVLSVPGLQDRHGDPDGDGKTEDRSGPPKSGELDEHAPHAGGHPVLVFAESGASPRATPVGVDQGRPHQVGEGGRAHVDHHGLPT